MVEGRIEFVPGAPLLAAADVEVWIEDTTYADAEAVTMFHVRMPNVSCAGSPGGLPFRLDYEPPRRDGRTYTLAVLVDVDGDGRVGPGDYVSVEAVRVPDEGTVARVRVQRIE